MKSGQKLTCAAVQMPNSQQFAVILDNSVSKSNLFRPILKAVEHFYAFNQF